MNATHETAMTVSTFATRIRGSWSEGLVRQGFVSHASGLAVPKMG